MDENLEPPSPPQSSTASRSLPNSLSGWLSLWFGVSDAVSQKAYFVSGLGLMIFKYCAEAATIWGFSQRFFSPGDFFNPLLSMRQAFYRPPVPEWVPWVIFFWSLPFLWIAVSMSVRRAYDAGLNPWRGLLVLCPFINFVAMLILSVYPHSTRVEFEKKGNAAPSQVQIRSALIGILASNLIALLMVGISVYVLKDYGATLFLATPILMGAISAFTYNRPNQSSLMGSLIVSQISIMSAGFVLLLFAFEGAICLVMLSPIVVAMGFLGGMIGHFLAAHTPTQTRHMTYVLLLLPFLAGAESTYRPVPVYEVASSVEINAPPEKVWEFVVGFSDLPDPDPWYFRLGIAYPKRATIEGSGVGAIRHCEFSTGSFVEPITEWRFPERLAFDVTSQPPPMHELSPYRHVHPPHLDGYLRCKKGEFRLVRLDNNKTRLEGSTWYEFEMYPQDYWTLWSDAAIHRIHLRVLEHIKHLAESSSDPDSIVGDHKQ